MYLLNNLKFNERIARTLGDVQYPKGWFLNAIHRDAVGVVEVPDPVLPDPELYTYVENADGSLTVTERTAEDIAERQANALANFQAGIVYQTQERLDTFARTRGYDNILSACTYATGGVPKFAAEGQYAVAARDNTWAALYTLLADVQAGTTPMPTGFADIEPLLPVLAWPN